MLRIELSSVLTGFQMFPTMFGSRDITSLLKVAERFILRPVIIAFRKENSRMQTKCPAN